MINLEQAIEFIRSNGAALDQARLQFILDQKRPGKKVNAEFIALQRRDGSWSPFWAPDHSSLDATCFHLAQGKQLGIADHEAVFKPAFEFLAKQQKPDGSWEEDPLLASQAPPWAQPGNQPATLYLTANCSYWLSTVRSYREKAVVGAWFLAEHLDGAGHLPSFMQTHWLSGGLWYRLGMAPQAESVLGYLEAKLANLSAHNLTWLLTTLKEVGLKTQHPLVAAAKSKLVGLQQRDGCWPSDDGTSFDVHTTLEALYALKLCHGLEEKSAT